MRSSNYLSSAKSQQTGCQKEVYGFLGNARSTLGFSAKQPSSQQFFNSCNSFNIFRLRCKIFKTIKGEREKQQWEIWDERLLANCFSPALSHCGFPWTIQCRQCELRSRLIKRLWKSPISSLMALSTQASSYLEWYPNWKGHRFSHEKGWRSGGVLCTLGRLCLD